MPMINAFCSDGKHYNLDYIKGRFIRTKVGYILFGSHFISSGFKSM